MDGVEAVQHKILCHLSTAGQEAVPFDNIVRGLGPDGSRLATQALRGLIERGKVTLRKGVDDDPCKYVSLANNLTEHLSIVLEAVRACGSNAVDLHQLVAKLRLPKTEIQKALNTLVAQQLVKERRSFTNRARRMYLLFNLEPSSSVTGGTFYCGEELDVKYVDDLRGWTVNFVLHRRSASLEEITLFIEGAIATGDAGPTSDPASPITFIHSTSSARALDFPAAPRAPPPAPTLCKRVSPQDVQVLVQSLVLDGVLAEVQASAGTSTELQYQIATGANLMRHFTCRHKRRRSENTAPMSPQFPDKHAELLEVVREAGLYEAAPISLSSVDLAGGWAYMPATGFPCLGCPQLANCSHSGKGLINPKQCAYMQKWLQ